jgi:hypothetical protein
MQRIFKFIKAEQFFPLYCKDIKCFRHKLRGKNGHDKPIDFTDEEKRQIRQGIKKLFADLKAD